MLERAKKNRGKVTKIEDIFAVDKNGKPLGAGEGENSGNNNFWSKVANMFNPFQCDNK